MNSSVLTAGRKNSDREFETSFGLHHFRSWAGKKLTCMHSSTSKSWEDREIFPVGSCRPTGFSLSWSISSIRWLDLTWVDVAPFIIYFAAWLHFFTVLLFMYIDGCMHRILMWLIEPSYNQLFWRRKALVLLHVYGLIGPFSVTKLGACTSLRVKRHRMRR